MMFSPLVSLLHVVLGQVRVYGFSAQFVKTTSLLRKISLKYFNI